MKTDVILWSCKEIAPLGRIFRSVSEIKDAKLWRVETYNDEYCVVVAKTRRKAVDAYDEFLQIDDLTDPNDVTEWQD